MSKISPQTYNQRCLTLELVECFIAKKLFSTQKDALLYIIYKAKIDKATTGFQDKFTLEDIATKFDKIYHQFLDFKKVVENENSNAQNELVIL